jgi:hypothetical protein
MVIPVALGKGQYCVLICLLLKEDFVPSLSFHVKIGQCLRA